MSAVGCQSMVDPIQLCLLKSPRQAHGSQAAVDAQWQALHYFGRPDYAQVLAEYDGFVSLLSQHGAELLYLPDDAATGMDSVYAHDPLVVTNRGVILCNMGKAQRTGEPAAAAAFLVQHGIPILGEIRSPGTLEGGDVCWLDARTVAVGEGYRTNAEGIRQLRELLGDLVDAVIPVPLPHWTGPDDCLHLLSFISPVDHDKAVVLCALFRSSRHRTNAGGRTLGSLYGRRLSPLAYQAVISGALDAMPTSNAPTRSFSATCSAAACSIRSTWHIGGRLLRAARHRSGQSRSGLRQRRGGVARWCDGRRQRLPRHRHRRRAGKDDRHSGQGHHGRPRHRRRRRIRGAARRQLRRAERPDHAALHVRVRCATGRLCRLQHQRPSQRRQQPQRHVPGSDHAQRVRARAGDRHADQHHGQQPGLRRRGGAHPGADRDGRTASPPAIIAGAVRILASASANDTLAVHDRHDPLFLAAAQISSQKALRQAGVRWTISTSSNCTTRLRS
jgi:N-dimethylarginine dimethylaminohydrolase